MRVDEPVHPRDLKGTRSMEGLSTCVFHVIVISNSDERVY